MSLFKALKNQKRSEIVHTFNVVGTVIGGLVGIVIGYKVGGIVGALAGVWFVSVIVGIIFYGLAHLLCTVAEHDG